MTSRKGISVLVVWVDNDPRHPESSLQYNGKQIQLLGLAGLAHGVIQDRMVKSQSTQPKETDEDEPE